MKKQIPYRTVTADRFVFFGWLGLVFLGQALFPKEIPAMEWLSIGWLLMGLITVRASSALPLLLLTCTVFLCEPHRAWAWVQPLAVLVLLMRLWLEGCFSRRDTLLIALAGLFVAWASWPANSGPLLLELRAYPHRELVTQWLRPEASWAIFPFRASADRALIAMLAAALIIKPRYVSTPCIWKALFVAGLFAVAVTSISTIIPWHKPHRFLGTTNFTSYGPYLFHGAGYNACYVPILLGAALPWFFTTLSHRHRWLHVGSIGLLPPLYFLTQRSLTLTAIAIVAAWVLLLIHALFNPGRRKRVADHFRQFRGAIKGTAVVLLLSLLVTSTWLMKMDFLKADSPIRATIQAALHRQNSTWSKPIPYGKPTLPDDSSPEAQSNIVPSRGARLEQFLARFDPTRAHMWTLGLRHVIHEGVWHGAGAGTWARFHRSQPRPTSLYFAHMHNMFLDLIFEYGLIPMLLIYAFIGLRLLQRMFGKSNQPRIWLVYFAGLAAVATGQHLFYYFSPLCLLIPGMIVLLRGR